MGQVQSQTIDNIKETQEQDRSQRPNLGSDRRGDIPKTGTCVVVTSWAVGRGSLCEVNILGNGHPSGVTVADAYSPSAVLSPGDVVTYEIRKTTGMTLTSGGVSQTTINNIVNEGGGSDVFFGTQFFSIFEGGVKGTFDGG